MAGISVCSPPFPNAATKTCSVHRITGSSIHLREFWLLEKLAAVIARTPNVCHVNRLIAFLYALQPPQVRTNVAAQRPAQVSPQPALSLEVGGLRWEEVSMVPQCRLSSGRDHQIPLTALSSTHGCQVKYDVFGLLRFCDATSEGAE
ncbi:unnamed protein product [Taenia asiatica]|uniref:Uncharacterized protein n=1 Tax=Taenia asiatica TaxID=60517 RepID=A0A0R3WEC6_TAEAS|nr:unnamed protein product [Taenia asiatica]